MKSPSRALLAALLVAVGALIALTLSVGAQTPGGEPGPDESGATETAQGRIIARVQDRTGEDGVDDYRIEFGFFPEWALDEAESWPEAIASRSDWLPSSRFLTKSRIDARAAADNRGWLRSSLISVPAQSTQSPGGDQTAITGRVIARYNPDSEGHLRVEFGFVPEWAFTDTSSTAEAVERLGADSLPRARYLRVATIDANRDIWLRSSVIDVPLRAPVVVIEQPQAPMIDSVTCSPSSPTVDESVTCTATLSGGAPETYTWSGGGSSGSGATYITSFGDVGEQTVSLTVTNAAGGDTEPTTLIVEQPLQAPVIDGISCTPSRPATADEDVTCTATLSGGVPDSWSWSGGVSGSNAAAYSPSFGEEGDHAISLTVADAAGSDTDSIILSVGDLQAPVVNAVNCAPSAPVVDREITCTADLSGGAPETYTWSGGGSSGSGATYTTSFSKAGEYTVSLTVTNSAGSDTDSITINVEETADQPEVRTPVIDAINCSPSAPTVGEETVCAADFSGHGPVSWAWSGGASNGSIPTYTTSFSTAGEHTVSLTVTNSGGSDTDSITINVEQPAEQSTVQAPVIDSIDCTRSRVAVNPSGYTDCTASLSGGAPASWAWSGGDPSPPYVHRSTDRSIYGAYFSAPDGRTIERTISLTVENAGGSDTASITITVVPAEQALSISCSPTTVVVGETVTCQIDSRHGDGIRGYYWSTLAGSGSVSPVNSVTSTYSPSFSRTGVKTIRLSVTRRWLNRDANVATTTVTVNLPSGLPRIDRNSFSCSPSSPTVGDDVTCTAAVSGGEPDSWAWSVRPSRVAGNASGSGERFTTSFNRPGLWDVRLIVRNAVGGDSDEFPLEIAPPAPVINSITCSPSSPTVNESVACTAELGGGMHDAWVSWDWSGGAGSGDSAAYNTSFGSAGSGTVSLTVTNSAGSDTDNLTLTVLPPPPVISGITCSPASPTVDQSVTCTANLSGGAPDSYAWSGGASNGGGVTYSTSFGAAGETAVSLTVTNSGGSDTESTTVSVAEPLQAPVIDGIVCSPSSTNVGREFICTATLSGGAPDSYAWSGAANGNKAVYQAFFRSAGSKTISLTVTNSAGSDTDSTTVSVVVVQAPVIYSVDCSPESPTVGESVTCTATLSGDAPDTYYWIGGASSGSSAEYRTSFSSAGSKTVGLQVTNVAGSSLGGVGLTVLPPSPAINGITCSPESPTVDESVTCTATLSGGAPDSYSWSGGASSGSGATYTTSFATAGVHTVSLTVTNSVGSDSSSRTLTVPPASP